MARKPPTVCPALGDRLRQTLIELGETPCGFARRLGIGETTLYRLSRRDLVPSQQILQPLADYWKTTIDELLFPALDPVKVTLGDKYDTAIHELTQAIKEACKKPMGVSGKILSREGVEQEILRRCWRGDDRYEAGSILFQFATPHGGPDHVNAGECGDVIQIANGGRLAPDARTLCPMYFAWVKSCTDAVRAAREKLPVMQWRIADGWEDSRRPRFDWIPQIFLRHLPVIAEFQRAFDRTFRVKKTRRSGCDSVPAGA